MGNRHWINELFHLAAMTPSREQIYRGPGRTAPFELPHEETRNGDLLCAAQVCIVGRCRRQAVPRFSGPDDRRPAATAGGPGFRQVLRLWRLDQARRRRPGEGVRLEATVFFQFMAEDAVTSQRMSQMTV